MKLSLYNYKPYFIELIETVRYGDEYYIIISILIHRLAVNELNFEISRQIMLIKLIYPCKLK